MTHICSHAFRGVTLSWLLPPPLEYESATESANDEMYPCRQRRHRHRHLPRMNLLVWSLYLPQRRQRPLLATTLSQIQTRIRLPRLHLRLHLLSLLLDLLNPQKIQNRALQMRQPVASHLARLPLPTQLFHP